MAPASEPSAPLSGPESKPRRHHFVPKFLLAGFTLSGRSSDQLWEYDLVTKRGRKRPPASVGAAANQYAVNVPGESPHVIEEHLGRVERQAASVIRSIITTRSCPTGNDFVVLVYFLGLMYGRSPMISGLIASHYEGVAEMLVQQAALSRNHYQAAMRVYPDGAIRPTYETIQKWAQEENPFSLPAEHVSAIAAQSAVYGMSDDSLQRIAARNWSVLVADEQANDFICCDCPMSIWWVHEAAKQQFRQRGWPPPLHSVSTETLLPIHRRVALLGHFDEAPEVIVASQRQVMVANTRTAYYAQRYLYGSTASIDFWSNETGFVRADEPLAAVGAIEEIDTT